MTFSVEPAFCKNGSINEQGWSDLCGLGSFNNLDFDGVCDNNNVKNLCDDDILNMDDFCINNVVFGQSIWVTFCSTSVLAMTENNCNGH